MTNTVKTTLLLIVAALAGGMTSALFFSRNSTTQEPSVVATDSAKSTQTTSSTTPSTSSVDDTIAFFYQTVGKFVNGTGNNTVEAGSTVDGISVSSYGVTTLDWNIGKNEQYHYGDPVMSRLSDGNWAMTAWSGQRDPRGAAFLLYHEASCPVVNDADVIAVGPSTAAGCKQVRGIDMAKTSQVFEGPDGNYVFHMIGGEIYLAHLSDASHSAMDLESMCILPSPVSTMSSLEYGESTLVIGAADSENMLLSDTAIARRSDGTWVMFVKGIKKDSGCTAGGSICELCARNIYRTTSTDLLNWSPLEVVVEQASVPEATTMPDGTVWLYWQDFDDACAAQDQIVAGIAPITAAYELPDTFELSEPEHIRIPDEKFETNKKIHYATNGNPVSLPNSEALAAYEACMK